MVAWALVVISATVGGAYYSYFRLALNSASLRGALGFGLLCAVPFSMIWLLLGGAKLNALGSPSRQIRLWVIAWVATYFVLAWAAFMLQETKTYSRGAVSLAFIVGMVVIPLMCVIGSKYLSRAFAEGRLVLGEIAFIGVGDVHAMEREVAAIEAMGFRVAARTIISPVAMGRNAFLEGCKLAARDISGALGNHRLEGIWILAPWEQNRHVDELKSALSHLPLSITLFAEGEIGALLKSPLRKYGELSGVEVQRAPLTRTERAIKRTLDIFIASLALIMLSPIMAASALAIIIESGRPVLFRQSRKGFGGKPFNILKFRSMSVQENGAVVTQAQRQDARVTRVGRILRRTSIDELPQLFNVLKGDMSIVGPRPHAIAHDTFYDRMITTYAFRHHVKPGITGWAQVNGLRGNTAELSKMEARVEKDLWYINHWSFWLDVRIIIRTAIEVMRHDEAY